MTGTRTPAPTVFAIALVGTTSRAPVPQAGRELCARQEFRSVCGTPTRAAMVVHATVLHVTISPAPTAVRVGKASQRVISRYRTASGMLTLATTMGLASATGATGFHARAVLAGRGQHAATQSRSVIGTQIHASTVADARAMDELRSAALTAPMGGPAKRAATECRSAIGTLRRVELARV